MMDENCLQVTVKGQDETEFASPEITIHEEPIVTPVVEYKCIYDENQVLSDQQDILENTDSDVIQPMMPFFIGSPFFAFDEDDESEIIEDEENMLMEDDGNEYGKDESVEETIILEIEENEVDKPIPDEHRDAMLEKFLCKNKTNNPIDSYICDVCEAIYGCLKCLKSHYETMHLGNTVIARYKCKYSLNVSKSLFCPVCELMFNTKSETMDHYIKHAVGCDICGSGFDRQQYLIDHLKMTHNKGSYNIVYDCEICKVEYQCESSLTKHYQNFHKMVLCVECKSKFETATDLQEHEKSHREKINVLPFACSKCNKAFPQISDIARHLRVDHTKKISVIEKSMIETVYVSPNVKSKKIFKVLEVQKKKIKNEFIN